MINTDDRIDLVQNEEINPGDSIHEDSSTPSSSTSSEYSSPKYLQSNNNQITNFHHNPNDSCSYVYLVFYLLGIITMTPWNFFITSESVSCIYHFTIRYILYNRLLHFFSIQYWMFKFRNISANQSDMNLTPIQERFSCDLTLTASVSGTIFLILHAIYGQKFSHRLKIVGCLTVIFLMFILTAAFVDINTDSWQEQFFLITLCIVLILNGKSHINYYFLLITGRMSYLD